MNVGITLYALTLILLAPSSVQYRTAFSKLRYLHRSISSKMADNTNMNSGLGESTEFKIEDGLSNLLKTVSEYQEDALLCIQNSMDSKEVEIFRVAFLGKNGKITGLMKEMKSLPVADKPKLGEVINNAKTAIDEAIVEAKERLRLLELQEQIESESLGNTIQISGTPIFFPTVGSRHPISLVLDMTTKIFADIGYEPITECESSPEIENDFFNFEALGMPPYHPARDMQDTFYINTTGFNTNDTLLLRTHTSAVQIREMEKRKPPFKIVVPGRVYRKDDVDATHFPVFHQVEILAIDEMGKLTVPHLLGTVKYFLRKMFGPDIECKYRSSYFPFTEPSIEVDVFFRGRWLEVLGCGMVDPVVLQAVGLDPEKYSGFAAGFGVERFAMIMHNIQDIRLFWENNVEFLKQFPSVPYAIPGDDEEERRKDAGRMSMDDLEYAELFAGSPPLDEDINDMVQAAATSNGSFEIAINSSNVEDNSE